MLGHGVNIAAVAERRLAGRPRGSRARQPHGENVANMARARGQTRLKDGNVGVQKGGFQLSGGRHSARITDVSCRPKPIAAVRLPAILVEWQEAPTNKVSAQTHFAKTRERSILFIENALSADPWTTEIDHSPVRLPILHSAALSTGVNISLSKSNMSRGPSAFTALAR